MYTDVYIHEYLCICIHLSHARRPGAQEQSEQTRKIHTHKFSRTHTHPLAHTPAHIYWHSYLHTRTHTRTYAHTHIDTRTHTHRQTYTYIFIYIFTYALLAHLLSLCTSIRWMLMGWWRKRVLSSSVMTGKRSWRSLRAKVILSTRSTHSYTDARCCTWRVSVAKLRAVASYSKPTPTPTF